MCNFYKLSPFELVVVSWTLILSLKFLRFNCVKLKHVQFWYEPFLIYIFRFLKKVVYRNTLYYKLNWNVENIFRSCVANITQLRDAIEQSVNKPAFVATTCMLVTWHLITWQIARGAFSQLRIYFQKHSKHKSVASGVVCENDEVCYLLLFRISSIFTNC